MILDQNPLALLALLALLSLLPLVAIATTSYLKLSVVLVLVRNALGVQQAPTTLALNAIALVGTMFVMAPTLSACMAQASQVVRAPAWGLSGASGATQIETALEVVAPLKQFVIRNGRAEERARFLEMAKRTWPEAAHHVARADDWSIAVPAFVVSELQSAFEIGLLLFIPFVAVDLLVSNVLLAMGMQMVPPMIVALPIKLLLFVLADGWGKLLHALVLSYQG